MTCSKSQPDTVFIFKHLTVHQKLKSCLAPSSIQALDSGAAKEVDISPGTVVMGFPRPVPGITPDTSSGTDLLVGPAQSMAVHLHITPWLQEGFTDILKGSWGGKGKKCPLAQPTGRGHLLHTLRQLVLASLFMQVVSG